MVFDGYSTSIDRIAHDFGIEDHSNPKAESEFKCLDHNIAAAKGG